MGKIIVRRAGPLTTVQDLGRPRQRHAGIAPGGALDPLAARVANLLVGNPETAALLEITLGPAEFSCTDERVVALCGAEVHDSLGKPIRLSPNESLKLRAPRHGCRVWLAIAGGLAVPPVLGSCATDLRGGFGGWEGRALRDGDELPLGPAVSPLNFSGRTAPWGAPTEWARTAARHPVLRVIPGAEWDDFAPATRTIFLHESYAVAAAADRMGARLAGPALPRLTNSELLSEAVAPGTIQVAHDGQPIVLLGDCQTIGGYPKIAHVITVDLPLAAQLRPNDIVRFQPVAPGGGAETFCAPGKTISPSSASGSRSASPGEAHNRSQRRSRRRPA